MAPKKKARRAAVKEPRPEEQGYDLKLLCAGKASVLVSSQLLLRSTRSVAIEDIITKLREENPNACHAAPMELAVKEDSAADWKVVWRLVENPMVEKLEGLTWDNYEAVTALADKYELTCVLQAMEAVMLANVPQDLEVYEDDDEDAAPFGYLTVEAEGKEDDFKLELSLLEVLHRAQMHKAITRLLPAYTYLLERAVTEGTGLGHRIRIMTRAVPASSPVHALVTSQIIKELEGMP